MSDYDTDIRAGLIMRLAAVALGVLVTGAAQGQEVTMFYTGNQLLARCESQVLGDVGVCFGFIAGISDVLSWLSPNGNSLGGYRACIPRAVDNAQARDVVMRQLRAHPEDRHLGAASLVSRALSQAFPCK